MCIDHLITSRYFPGVEFYTGRLYQHWSPSVGGAGTLIFGFTMPKFKADPVTAAGIKDSGRVWWNILGFTSQDRCWKKKNVIVGLFLEGLPRTLTARIVLRPAPTRLPSKSRVSSMMTPAAATTLVQIPRACHRCCRIYSRPCRIPQQTFVVRSQSTRNHSVVTSKTILSHRVGGSKGGEGEREGIVWSLCFRAQAGRRI